MKKIILAMAALVCSMSVNAQTVKIMKGETVVDTYKAADYDKVVFEEQIATSKMKIKFSSSSLSGVQAVKLVTSKAGVQTPYNITTKNSDGSFDVEIPSQTYDYYVIYPSTDGTTYKEAMATKTATAITADVNIDYVKNAMRLWANGPYFATEYSGDMAWAAGMNGWGGAWTLASKDDLTNLYNGNNATRAWTQVNSVWGFKFTGKANGYTGYSIFLPSDPTFSDASSGQVSYWSSTTTGNASYYVDLVYTGSGYDSYWNSGSRNGSFYVYRVLK